MWNWLQIRNSRFNGSDIVGWRAVRSLNLWVNLVLVAAIMPFGLFGWSLHSLLPGHDHSTCGHVSTACAHSHSESSHSHNHAHHHHDSVAGHSHSVSPDGATSDVVTDTEPTSTPISMHSVHDCELCKVLQQLRSSHFQVQVFASGEIQIPLCWVRQQNAIVASLSAYYLRGPPLA